MTAESWMREPVEYVVVIEGEVYGLHGQPPRDLSDYDERQVMILCSEWYSKKLWTKKERQSAQARAFREHREYILPLRLDDTSIPGIEGTIAYLNFSEVGLDGVIDAIVQKVADYRAQ